jgi:hypothetical protein
MTISGVWRAAREPRGRTSNPEPGLRRRLAFGLSPWERCRGVSGHVARHGDKLALVNGRFDLGLPPPFGRGAPPGTDYDVVLVNRR